MIIHKHLDMVTEKNSTPTIARPTRSPCASMGTGLASGTTLGADNGVGVAIALAAGEGLFADHPPLELLFTIDEETGMSGARARRSAFGQAVDQLRRRRRGHLIRRPVPAARTASSRARWLESRRAGELTVEIRASVGLKGAPGAGYSAQPRQRDSAVERALLRLERDGVASGDWSSFRWLEAKRHPP